MSNNTLAKQEGISSLNIITDLPLTFVQNTMERISQFQAVIQKTLKQNHDFGFIPGCGKKPTLFKPGAEKLIVMMGISPHFETEKAIEDFEKGFFFYRVRCILQKNNITVAQCLGSCNSRESKYIKQDACTIANTILKMAQKRALVGAALHAGSLSEVFTQDIEDMDLNGQSLAQSNQKVYTDRSGVISGGQAKRLYAISKGNGDLCKRVMAKYGYKSSKEIEKINYDKICQEVENTVKRSEHIQEEMPYTDKEDVLCGPYSTLPTTPGTSSDNGSSAHLLNAIVKLCTGELGKSAAEICPYVSSILKQNIVELGDLKNLPEKELQYLIEKLNKRINDKIQEQGELIPEETTEEQEALEDVEPERKDITDQYLEEADKAPF